jgi:hypothetical protein
MAMINLNKWPAAGFLRMNQAPRSTCSSSWIFGHGEQATQHDYLFSFECDRAPQRLLLVLVATILA